MRQRWWVPGTMLIGLAVLAPTVAGLVSHVIRLPSTVAIIVVNGALLVLVVGVLALLYGLVRRQAS